MLPRPWPALRRQAADGARLWRLSRRDPRLGWLLLDNLITTFGASFTLIALPFLVMRLTGRAFDLGLTAAIEALPSALLLGFGRGLLDRFDPLRVLWWCRACYVALNAALAILAGSGRIAIESVYAIALLGGLVWALAYPAGRASFGLYIRKPLLSAGNAVFAVASSLAMTLLPMLAGSLILSSDDARGLAWAFWIDAACVAASLWLLAAVRRRGPVRRSGNVDANAAVEACAQASATTAVPRSYYAYLLASTVLAFGPVQVLLPLLLVERGDARYFLVYLAQFAGIAVAAPLAARASERLPTVLGKILLCWAAAALAYALLAASAALAPTLAAFCLLAAASNYYGIQSLSWLQRNADAQRMGREMTWFSAATMGAMPLATLLAGLLADRLRLAPAAAALAAAIALCLLLGVWHLQRSLRRGGYENAPGAQAPGARVR